MNKNIFRIVLLVIALISFSSGHAQSSNNIEEYLGVWVLDGGSTWLIDGETGYQDEYINVQKREDKISISYKFIKEGETKRGNTYFLTQETPNCYYFEYSTDDGGYCRKYFYFEDGIVKHITRIYNRIGECEFKIPHAYEYFTYSREW